MPSLSALGEFKSSFQNLGNEIRTLQDLELPIDDFPLPDHEPAVTAKPPAPDTAGLSDMPDLDMNSMFGESQGAAEEPAEDTYRDSCRRGRCRRNSVLPALTAEYQNGHFPFMIGSVGFGGSIGNTASSWSTLISTRHTFSDANASLNAFAISDGRST